MLRVQSSRSFAAGVSQDGHNSFGSFEAPTNNVIDNVLALMSIGLVATAGLFAVQAWIEVTAVKVMLFALLYLVTRGLIRCLFELKARAGDAKVSHSLQMPAPNDPIAGAC